jgi:hypothetical protein
MAEGVKKGLAQYEKIVATQPGIEIKGNKSSYTSMNGHMFSYLQENGGLALRLPKEARDAFLKQYKTKLAVAYETVMKEYAVVPPKLMTRTAVVAKHFAVSIAYIASLKPKATTRKKSTKKKAAAKKTTKKKATKKAAPKASTKKKSTAKKATKKKAAKKKVARKRKTAASRR